jgi:hypothetical protein
VPDEPIDLPVNQPLRLRVEADAAVIAESFGSPLNAVERLRAAAGRLSVGTLTNESLRRENLYDGRA